MHTHTHTLHLIKPKFLHNNIQVFPYSSLDWWFSTCGPLISSISFNWELVEVQILRDNPRFTESETLGIRPAICVLTNPSWDSDAC